ncbi:MAG TPA: undecaprenyl-phosphate glucose phosphotransferase [Steroidobacteraceae bacterium]|nr:undecaprenyl-phosphate glucose phosphotransferase [Steroidobacteraceae bacterium]
MNSPRIHSAADYQSQVSQPIIFKRGTSLMAPVLLWLMDALPAVLAGVMFYPLTRLYDVEYDRPFLVLSILAATLTLAVLPGNTTSQVVSSRIELATNMLWRWAVLVACLLALGYVTKFSEEFSRRVVVTWVLVTPVLLVILQLLLHAVTRALLMDSAHARRAIIVGCTTASQELARRLARHTELGMSVAGFFDDRGSDRLGCADHAQLLGRFADVPHFVKSRGIDVIFIAIPPGQVSRMRDLVGELGDTTASIYFVPDVSGFDMIQQRTSEILGLPVVAMCETPFHGYRGLVKRLMDVTLASLGILLLSPMLLGIAWAVRRGSPGPVLFRQRRYGLDGREIQVYKFRTMTVAEDGTRVTQARRNDARVTPIGRHLRRWSLDELPQLLNVLQGTMSLVGPRPHAVAHNEEYRKLIKRYMVRHKVLPGITGLAQVRGCRGETTRVEDMEARVVFDLEYMRNWSPLLDLQILVATVIAVIRTDRAY